MKWLLFKQCLFTVNHLDFCKKQSAGLLLDGIVCISFFSFYFIAMNYDQSNDLMRMFLLTNLHFIRSHNWCFCQVRSSSRKGCETRIEVARNHNERAAQKEQETEPVERFFWRPGYIQEIRERGVGRIPHSWGPPFTEIQIWRKRVLPLLLVNPLACGDAGRVRPAVQPVVVKVHTEL